MSCLVRRLLATAALAVPCTAHALDWRFVDQVTPPTAEHALICHLWNATVYAPGEKGSCYVGTIYAANLTTGEIGYAAAGDQGMPSSHSERELNRDTLIRALKGDALAKLDALHGKLESERAASTAAAAAEREKVNAERAHAEYLQAFQDAKTLERIRDFETRYGDNDPDGLIAGLARTKTALEHQAYRDAYAGAATSAQLQAFIDAYGARDPDRLLPDARKRLASAKKQEQLAAQAVEKKGREDAARQEAATRQAALKKDAERLKYIRSLQARFGDRITAESAEGYSIVSRYRIDCRAGDGRVLPLLNALYASIVSLDGNSVQMRFHIQNRGQQVRITSEVTKNGKPTGPRQLYYEINEWGDLRAIAIRNEAVLNACHGFQGSIWLMPGEPGYQ